MKPNSQPRRIYVSELCFTVLNFVLPSKIHKPHYFTQTKLYATSSACSREIKYTKTHCREPEEQ